MKEKQLYSVDVLMKALYDRGSRPPELEHVSENMIVEQVIYILDHHRTTDDQRRRIEHRMWHLLSHEKFNAPAKRKALKYFKREVKHGHLRRKLVRKIEKFCREHKQIDWVQAVCREVT